MIPTRRQFIVGVATAGLVSTSASRATPSDALTPEMFGATGDGRTNDTAAFAALSAQLNARGGGTVILRPVTYIVGAQRRSATGSYSPVDILHFESCAGSIIIKGNGARLRAANGLRFGTFDLKSGTAAPNGLPKREYFSRLASAYPGMIYIHNCRGNIEITDLELDGNLEALNRGGKYNEAIGWHAQANGIWLRANRGPAAISHLYVHHHGLDGVLFTDDVDREGYTTVSDVRSEYNGRDAGSITSGRNYVFRECRFVNSGKAGMRNAPAAGFDIEAEASTIRNVRFSACEFSDNAGMGVDAGGGDSADISFDRCKFVGTDRWSAWPNKPQMRFSKCIFVGSIIYAYGDRDSARAAQFLECTFTDDAALSPTGKVFVDRGSIAIIPDNQNATFARCKFRLVGKATLPLSTNVIYSDCTMSQRSRMLSHPNGTYLGTTTITGNADLSASRIRGTVLLNGQPLSRTA